MPGASITAQAMWYCACAAIFASLTGMLVAVEAVRLTVGHDLDRAAELGCIFGDGAFTGIVAAHKRVLGGLNRCFIHTISIDGRARRMPIQCSRVVDNNLRL